MSDALLEGTTPAAADTGPEVTPLGEGRMVREDCWREVHRLFHVERRSKSEIARELDLDRKTVRGDLAGGGVAAVPRAERIDTLLAEHAAYLQQRAPAGPVLGAHPVPGVAPGARLPRQLRDREALRAAACGPPSRRPSGRRCASRRRRGSRARSTGARPGCYFRSRPVMLHVFILTLGYSRRSFHEPCLGETLSQFLDAHERAFEYFGGHTREHLYDRPRTVCQPAGEGASSGTRPSSSSPTTGASSRTSAGPIAPRPRARSNRA